MRKHFYLIISIFVLSVLTSQGATTRVDVLIVGGGASGVAAGIQSARMKVKTLIVEETPWLGGMLTAAGVSAIDGNNRLPAGLWGEFRDSLVNHYGSREALETGWVSNVQFEPSVANKIFHRMTAAEPNLTVWKETMVESVTKDKKKNGLWTVTVKDKTGQLQKIESKMLIDATELGDVAKMCGVKYDIGMESKSDTGEDIAPEKANDIIQDLTYVAILKDYGHDVTIPRPAGYDPQKFACTCKNELCIKPKEATRVWPPEKMITYGKLPNNKYMINWPTEGNDYYVNLVEMNREEREQALKLAKEHTMCFLYFIQNQLGMNTLGLADDEFPTADKLALIPYHRESRRIHGEVRFNLNDLKNPYSQKNPLYRTCIAVGDYPVDHHHAAYHGWNQLPNLYFYPVPSYGLPVGTLIPQDIEGLIVAEKSISVSNLVNGTTRLQPVVLQIGQAAGTLAALSIKEKMPVRKLPVRKVQNAILDAKGYLLPYLDVEKTSPLFQPLQHIGSTGILKGVGKSIAWRNQTWFRADTVLLASELEGLRDYYPSFTGELKPEPMKLDEALRIIESIAQKEKIAFEKPTAPKLKEISAKYAIELKPENPLTRGAMAVLIDVFLDPFNRKPVDLKGNLIKKQ